MNIAEAAVALFWAEFGPGSVSEGPDELARARLSEAATRAFHRRTRRPGSCSHGPIRTGPATLQAVRGWSSPSQGDAVEGPGGPTEIVALGFVDLVGSTAWSQALTLRDQNLALTRFESAAWSSAVLAGGRVIKMIGDEVFFYAPSVDAACHIGIDVCRAAADDDVLPAARGAVGFGAVTPREGDYYGPLVNLLSRLVKVGAPGELVATEAAVALLARRRLVGAPSGAGRLARHRGTGTGVRRRTATNEARHGQEVTRLTTRTAQEEFVGHSNAPDSLLVPARFDGGRPLV